MMPLKHAKVPCQECPWRLDVPPGKFPPERFRALAHTAYDMAGKVFACHMAPEGGEFACAGFILQSSMHNLSVRLSGTDLSDVRSPYQLYPNYRAMAVANGVDPNDHSLFCCRNDGQR